MAVSATPSTVTSSSAVVRTVPLRDYRCCGCGYGISVRNAPDECPMCRETVWEPVEWRPFTTGTAASALR